VLESSRRELLLLASVARAVTTAGGKSYDPDIPCGDEDNETTLQPTRAFVVATDKPPGPTAEASVNDDDSNARGDEHCNEPANPDNADIGNSACTTSRVTGSVCVMVSVPLAFTVTIGASDRQSALQTSSKLGSPSHSHNPVRAIRMPCPEGQELQACAAVAQDPSAPRV
jgi:hypothetical protein